MTSQPQNVKRLPLICKLLYLLAGVSALLYLAFTKSPAFADWFNSHVSFLGRRLLSYLTVWIPFSLAAWLLFLLPVFMVTLSVIAKRSYCVSWRSVGVYLADKRIDRLFTVGLGGEQIAVGARQRGMSRQSISQNPNAARLSDTARALAEELRDGDVVLFKASRSVGAEKIISELKTLIE